MSDEVLRALGRLGTATDWFRRLTDLEVRRENVMETLDEEADDDGEALILRGWCFTTALAGVSGATHELVEIAHTMQVSEHARYELAELQPTAAFYLKAWLTRAVARDPEAMAGHAARLVAHPHPSVRASLAGALLEAALPSEAMAAVLRTLAHDDDPAVRVAASPPGPTGLLPLDATAEHAAAFAALDPAQRALLDPRVPEWRRPKPADPALFEQALAAVPDSIAGVILPRMVPASAYPTADDASILRSLFARDGGVEAFLRAMVPRFEAAGVPGRYWEEPVAKAFDGPGPPDREAAVSRWLEAIEAWAPAIRLQARRFEPAVFLSGVLSKVAAGDPVPVASLLARLPPASPTFDERTYMLNALQGVVRTWPARP